MGRVKIFVMRMSDELWSSLYRSTVTPILMWHSL